MSVDPGCDRRPGRLVRQARRHELLVYLLLAFLLSWLPWPLVLLNPDSSPMVPFGPLVAAVVAAGLAGRRRLAALLAQLGRWRSAPQWYLVALTLPVLVTALAVAATRTVHPSASSLGAPTGGQVLVTFASTLVLVGLFEEVGWRGYALPRLQRTSSGLRAALLLGAVWALWHLPLLVSERTGQRPVVPFVILVLAQSVFLSWVYNSSAAGLPLVMISHASIDTAARFVLPQLVGTGYLLVWWCQAGLWAVLAVVIATTTGLTLNAAGRGAVGPTAPARVAASPRER